VKPWLTPRNRIRLLDTSSLVKKLIEATNILSRCPAKVPAPCDFAFRLGAMKRVYRPVTSKSVVVEEFGGGSLQARQINQLKCIPLPFETAGVSCAAATKLRACEPFAKCGGFFVLGRTIQVEF
jgi:hypothetical protein